MSDSDIASALIRDRLDAYRREHGAEHHDWFEYRNMICCKHCGIIQNTGNIDRPCPGTVRVELRSEV